MSNRTLILMVIFSLGLIAVSLYIISTIDPGKKPKPQGVISNVKELNLSASKDFKLFFSNGEEFSFKSLENKYSLLYFGFTFCPDVCPVTLDLIKEALGQLNGKTLDQLQAIFVSVDPERDSLKELQDFIKNFGSHIKAATGEEEEIKKLADSLKVFYMKAGDKDSAGDDYYVDHSSFIYLLNKDGELIAQFASTIKPEEMAAEINKQIK